MRHTYLHEKESAGFSTVDLKYEGHLTHRVRLPPDCLLLSLEAVYLQTQHQVRVVSKALAAMDVIHGWLPGIHVGLAAHI